MITGKSEYMESDDENEASSLSEYSQQRNEFLGNFADGTEETTKYFSNSFRGRIAWYFDLEDESDSTFQTELMAGVTVTLHPQTIAPDISELVLRNQTTPAGYTWEQVRGLPSSTAFATGIATMLMGLCAKAPIVISTGVNYGVPFRNIAHDLHSWELAIGLNAIVGMILFVWACAVRPFRITKAFPEDFRFGIGAGIGFFLAMVGLSTAGFGELSSTNVTYATWLNMIVAIISLSLIIVLQSQTSYTQLAYLVGIVASIVLGRICEYLLNPKDFTFPGVHYPSDLLFRVRFPSHTSCNETVGSANAPTFDFLDIDGNEHGYCAGRMVRYVLMTTINKIIDTIASVTTLVCAGCFGASEYDKAKFNQALGRSRQLVYIFIVDAVANVLVAPSFGVGMMTPFIESVALVVVGGRSGLAAVITGLLFVVAGTMATPLGAVITARDAAPALLASCFSILRMARSVDCDNPISYIPAFAAMVLVPFTGTIGNAVGAAYFILVSCHLFGGKCQEMKPQMVFFFFLFVLLYTLFLPGVNGKFFLTLLVTISLLIAGIICSFIFSNMISNRLIETIPSSDSDQMRHEAPQTPDLPAVSEGPSNVTLNWFSNDFNRGSPTLPDSDKESFGEAAMY